ncbi:hypothetical protein VTK56DRAFT_8750 [Thermocarpiscus australiensis]
MGLGLLFRVALFGASVQALVFPGPRPTDNIHVLREDGWTPNPTAAPSLPEVLRRQDNWASTYLLAPDNTCGYVSGSKKSAYACLDDDLQCAFVPSSGKVPGAIGCCNGNDCAFRVTCLDRGEMSSCDKRCQSDSFTLKCTGTARFCNTVAFPLGVTDYYCGTRRVSSVQKAETTYSGQRSRSLSTHVVKPTSTSTSIRSTTSSTSAKATSTKTESAKTSSSRSLTSESPSETSPTIASSAAGTTTAGPATATTSSSNSEAAPTPVGGIVGGVVGGIAGVALIVLGAIFVRQHQKKRLSSAPPAEKPTSDPPIQLQPQPPAGPSSYLSPQSIHSAQASQSQASPSTASNQFPPHMFGAPAAAAAASAAAAVTGASSANSARYPGPSPLSTPSASPRPPYQQEFSSQLQPPPPPPTSFYYQPTPQRPSQDQGRAQSQEETWLADNTTTTTTPPDRQDTGTPVSTYHNATPVAPVSALGSHPSEQPMGSGGILPGVPLVLQPGMGMQRLRPAPGAVPGSGSGSGHGQGPGPGPVQQGHVVQVHELQGSDAVPHAQSQPQPQPNTQAHDDPRDGAVELP